MHKNLWFDLQYFAEAGAAGDGGDGGSSAGVSAAGSESGTGNEGATVAAGQKVLEGLGVPADRREKWAKSKVRREIQTAREQQAGVQEQAIVQGGTADAESGQTGDASPGGSGRMSWGDILKDPEYKQAFDEQVQGIVRQRLSKTAQMQETMGKLQPALDFLATKYKLDTENLDYDRLVDSILKDDSILEEYADERGTSVENAREALQDKLELARLRKESRITMDRQSIAAHLSRLHEQAEEVRQYAPDFDVVQEIETNPVFARMTSPQIGMSVADAYFACHRKEILAARDQAQAQQAITAVTNTIRANQSRPRENGAAMPSTVATKSYKEMNAQEREAFKARLKREWANGNKPKAGTMF